MEVMKMKIKQWLKLSTLTLFILCVSLTYSFASADGWKTYTEGAAGGDNPAFVHSGYLYMCGGYAYFRAQLQSNGSFGEMTSLLTGNGMGLEHCAIATTGKWVYFVGGSIKASEYPNSIGIYYTKIDENGYLSDPLSDPSANHHLIIGRANCASLFVGDKLYVFGGYGTTTYMPQYALSSNEYGVIDTTYGGFTTSLKFTSSFSTISGTVYLAFNRGNRIYCLGEAAGTPGCYLEYTDIQSDGSLGKWTVLPGPFGFKPQLAVMTQSSTIFGVGPAGVSGHPAARMDISDNVIAGKYFRTATSSPISRNNPTIASWGHYIYLLGGDGLVGYDVYDPDMTGTDLFEENNSPLIQASESINVPMDLK
jgi:hypothetical protein